MIDEAFEHLKQACLAVKSSAGQGTGYFVSPNQIATCKQVVGDDAEVTVTLDNSQVKAAVIARDAEMDCAILQIENAVAASRPLSLAGGVKRKAVWDGYGFPRAGLGHAIPLTGEILDPDGRDTRDAPAMILYSDQVAAGMGTPLHGFSGSPIIVKGAVVGHLKRFVSDPDDDFRPAFGLVYACPS